MQDNIILALGTNYGDRLDNLRKAVNLLPLVNKKHSYVYESKALLPENAPDHWDIPFLNMVVSGSSTFQPLEFLSIIKNIERDLGRSNQERWSPRPIDIDIILWDDKVISINGLNIPHQQMQYRDFVLVPVYELHPDIIHPVTKSTIKSLLIEVSNSNLVKKFSLF